LKAPPVRRNPAGPETAFARRNSPKPSFTDLSGGDHQKNVPGCRRSPLHLCGGGRKGDGAVRRGHGVRSTDFSRVLPSLTAKPDWSRYSERRGKN